MVRKLNHGENLTRKELQEISSYVIPTKHFSQRCKERYGKEINLPDYINNCECAFFNSDGSINICKSSNECIVVVENETNKFIALTIKQNTKTNVYRHQMLASLGINNLISIAISSNV